MEQDFVNGFVDELDKIAAGKRGIGKTVAKVLGIGGAGAAAGVGAEKLLEGKRKKGRGKEFRKFITGRRLMMAGSPKGKILGMVSRRKGEEPGGAYKKLKKHWPTLQ